MKAFNFEFFTPEFQYKGSSQVDDLRYSFDYTDNEKNRVEVTCRVDIGDYITAKNGGLTICGVVKSVEPGEGVYKVDYEPLSGLFAVDIYKAFTEETVEEMLQNAISSTYETNQDALQNLQGLRITCTTETPLEAPYEDGVTNLMDLVQDAFTTYGVVCEWTINAQEKKIDLRIGKPELSFFNIEADLKNILEKNIVIRQSKETLNKITIINEEDHTQSLTYYKDINDQVTTTPETRVVPVNFSTVTAKVSSRQTFEEKALSVALTKLKASKYNNLMEFTTQEDDLLLRPYDRAIGQTTKVYSGGLVYETILSGFKFEKGRITLIFGTIRLELTKMIKKRWRRTESE